MRKGHCLDELLVANLIALNKKQEMTTAEEVHSTKKKLWGFEIDTAGINSIGLCQIVYAKKRKK